MECKEFQELAAPYLQNELNVSESKAYEMHLNKCEECRLVLSQTKEVLSLLDQSPVLEPPVEGKSRFLEALKKEKDIINPKESRQVTLTPIVYRVAAAVALLVIGFGAGKWMPSNQENSSELADLKSEVHSMKQMVMMSMLKDESASERIQAVNFVEDFDQPSPEVIVTLFRTLNEDESPNVRRAAIKALEKFSYDENVRLMLVRSFEFQTDPVVQITLIDLMVELEEKRAAKKFQQLIDEEGTQKIVKQQAEIGLQLLI